MAESVRAEARRRRLARRGVLTAAVIAVLIAGGAGAWAAARSPSLPYVTGAVRLASVAQVIQSRGTLEPVDAAEVDFPTAGLVAAVNVSLGQHVAAGAPLARLDTTALVAEQAGAIARLTAAESSLAAAEESASQPAASQPPPASSTTTAASAVGGDSSTQARHELAAAAKQAQGTQSAARTVQGLLGKDIAACTAALAGHAASSSPSSSASPTPSPTPTPSPGASVRSSAPASADVGAPGGISPRAATAGQDCLALLREALGDASQVSAGQGVLTHSLVTLLAGASDHSPASAGGAGADPSVQHRSAAPPAPASPEQIAADQAAVSLDRARVAAAGQALAEAVLTSPISGVVAAVNVQPGDAVTGLATSPAEIVVLGSGGFDVSTTVTAANRAQLAVGDTATVTPDGSTSLLTGTVASIGILPATSGAAAAYPVTIRLTGTPAGLVAGAGAGVSIVVRHAGDTLAVPTSAVRTIGARSVVRVLSGSRLRVVSVTVNAVGATYTAVRSAELTVGERVVLADLATALPSSQAGVRAARLAAGGGKFGGGKFGGGKFGGAGAFTGGGAGRGG